MSNELEDESDVSYVVIKCTKKGDKIIRILEDVATRLRIDELLEKIKKRRVIISAAIEGLASLFHWYGENYLGTAFSGLNITIKLLTEAHSSWKDYANDVWPRFISKWPLIRFIETMTNLVRGKRTWYNYPDLSSRAYNTREFLENNTNNLSRGTDIWWVTLKGSDFLTSEDVWVNHTVHCMQSKKIHFNAALFEPEKQFDFAKQEFYHMFKDPWIYETAKEVKWPSTENIAPHALLKKGYIFKVKEEESKKNLAEKTAQLDTASRLFDEYIVCKVLKAYKPKNNNSIYVWFYGGVYNPANRFHWPSIRGYIINDENGQNQQAIFLKGRCHRNAFNTTLTKVSDNKQFYNLCEEFNHLTPVKDEDPCSKVYSAIESLNIDEKIKKRVLIYIKQVDKMIRSRKKIERKSLIPIIEKEGVRDLLRQELQKTLDKSYEMTVIKSYIKKNMLNKQIR